MPDSTAPERWRVGRSVGRTVYRMVGSEASKDDTLIGVMDTPQLAARVVVAVNIEQVRHERGVQAALDALDDLLDLDALSNDDIEAVSAWANNIQLDIMRHRRLQGGSRA